MTFWWYSHEEKNELYEELDIFYTFQLSNLGIFLGADTNYYTGSRTKMFCDVVQPNGINNSNMKWKDFCLLKTNKFKLLLSYFSHSNYVTYRSFNSNKTLYAYDNYISCNQFFRRIQDYSVVDYGVISEHTAILIKFRITAI